MIRGSALAALLLAPALLATVGADTSAAWWESTLLDLDGDRIDDALVPELHGREPLIVLVAYDGVPTSREHGALSEAGFEIVNEYEHFDVIAVRVLPTMIGGLLDLPGVVFVEKNDVIVKLLKDSVPLIGAPQVWKDHGATGRGVTVAVLDDGAFEQHPDLDGKVRASYDAGLASRPGFGTSPASAPIVPAGDDGHATHVAGIIVGPGTQSNGRYRGVAPDAQFVDVKVFAGPDQTNSDIVLRGLDWVLSNAARDGTRVASMSLGGRPSDGRDALSRAVNVAVDKGMIVVAAAGNAGPDPQTVASPGAADKAITVGAVDKQRRIASYSSRGPTLDGRLKPDIVAPGSAIVSTIPPSSTTVAGAATGKADAFYGSLSGTSMAAPHVSGVVALMLQVNPSLSPTEVKQILVATAQDLGVQGPDPDTGHGFVNAIAATQVADDPTLLSSPRFASIIAALPPPREEDLWTRGQVEFDALVRSGMLPTYGAIAAGVLVIFFAGVLIGRRRRPL